MIGGGKGDGGGGGIIGYQLAWEVLLFPFKPGEWGAVLVTCVLTWFPDWSRVSTDGKLLASS